jgi:hypothetical protein
MDDGEEPPQTGTARPRTHDEPDGPPAPEDEFRSLAEDWIAIWQSEITAYLTDPETQQAWSAMMAIWAGAAQAMMRGMAAAPGFGQGFGPKRPKPPGRADERRRPGSATQHAAAKHAGANAAPRPAPAAAAPVPGDDEIRRLEQRVAELERSLAERDRAEQDRRRGAAGENRRPRRPVRPRG